jgi:predicted Ser/Thr protein kinase
MNTTTNKKALENLVSSRYGVNALNCDANVIEWAAGKLAETLGADVAACEWRRVNRRREKLGLYTTIPQFGSAMWKGFWA